MERIISHSPIETEEIGAKFSNLLKPGDVIAYKGGLGMGKTCFTRGVAKGLGYSGNVTSPTFDLINEYIGGRLSLYHFDMYRIESWEDLYSCGFFEYIESEGIVAVEWSENIENALPESTYFIEINRIDDTTREIIIRGNNI
ncbi:MAG: tRNA (adenosine(37)-N6)-threonylcarbamoyltransferase complex ATPase subunit type 1 TsaE [Clostridia bacterium]|nr:tRNA (adenosine(37)-N6)-threonylcarbamoyltransferase complex ATPase subunit type 1 TsaE [Clostridia bacterium]MBQ2237002.1 tRNA (adenosine(37)-N6)-threonylcarbamoyltransferase complex ATPase subunit type 1 TsaE [Clostridia bacterium]